MILRALACLASAVAIAFIAIILKRNFEDGFYELVVMNALLILVNLLFFLVNAPL